MPSPTSLVYDITSWNVLMVQTVKFVEFFRSIHSVMLKCVLTFHAARTFSYLRLD